MKSVSQKLQMRPHAKCQICGTPAYIKDVETDTAYCFACYEAVISKFTESEPSSEFPNILVVTDQWSEPHVFTISFTDQDCFTALIAEEARALHHQCAVYADHDESIGAMLARLLHRIKQRINTRYLNDEGDFIDYKAVGYLRENDSTEELEFFVDGAALSWHDLIERNIEGRDSWQMKIEIVPPDVWVE
ncbi:MAG: hypothetical protein LBB94_11580 [Clostridiales bacterium]|jgi:hypothetical protein|nr:hypothetical protein [Clostridiales bacterium]